MTSTLVKCYDFPEVVLHREDCPRYSGGVCHPEPRPAPPYDEDQAKAVMAYDEIMSRGIQGQLVKATGMTGARRDQLDD